MENVNFGGKVDVLGVDVVEVDIMMTLWELIHVVDLWGEGPGDATVTQYYKPTV